MKRRKEASTNKEDINSQSKAIARPTTMAPPKAPSLGETRAALLLLNGVEDAPAADAELELACAFGTVVVATTPVVTTAAVAEAEVVDVVPTYGAPIVKESLVAYA